MKKPGEAVAKAAAVIAGDRRARLDRMPPAERARQQAAMAVALAQPHRKGRSDPRAGEPLWEFCRFMGLREELYRAGSDYEQISRAGKAALGLRVPGLCSDGSGARGAGDGYSAEDELAIGRYKETRDFLGVRAFIAVERVCYYHEPPQQLEARLLAQSLMRLADFFGLVDFGINRGKPFAAIANEKQPA